MLFSIAAAPVYVPPAAHGGGGVPFSPHPYHRFLSLAFLITAILTSVRRYLIMPLICVSLKIHDFENLSMYLSVICLSLER